MQQNPTAFSVVIATYNRPGPLTDCLRALTAQTMARDRFEVIVVDDGGDTDLAEVCSPFRSGLQLKLEKTANGGPAAARNHGASLARGRWLAFTDDDCEPEAGWLAGLEKRFAEHPRAMIGGHTHNRLRDMLFSQASQDIIDLVYRHYNDPSGPALFLTANNMALPREAFLETGGFDAEFSAGTAEDRELCERWLQAGRHIVYVPGLEVYHSHRLDLAGYFRQHFNYGRGARSFHRVCRDRRWRARGRDAGWQLRAHNWLLHPFRSGQSKPIQRMLALLIWQIANGLGYLWQTLIDLRSRPRGTIDPGNV